jgi:hypothetical protein
MNMICLLSWFGKDTSIKSMKDRFRRNNTKIAVQTDETIPLKYKIKHKFSNNRLDQNKQELIIC